MCYSEFSLKATSSKKVNFRQKKIKIKINSWKDNLRSDVPKVEDFFLFDNSFFLVKVFHDFYNDLSEQYVVFRKRKTFQNIELVILLLRTKK